jgi:ankyrin repeat protein
VHGSGKEYGKIVENLLQYGFTVNPEDVNDCKLLHAAVEKGCLKIVEELLKYGIDIRLCKSTSAKGYMPLHVVAKNIHEEVAKLLISYGADVNAQDETGKTPIFYATQNADLKIAKLLLTNKANVKGNPELLNIAVKKECREVVEVLLEHGVSVNRSDENGRTALHFTALGEDGGFFPFPRDKGPDINVKGEIAKLLLSRGANVDAETKNGITTLRSATQKGYAKVVEVFLEHNANVNCTVQTHITLLHIAARKGHTDVVKVLLKFGAIIDSKVKNDSTPLHIAARKGHTEVVKVLLKFGAIIDSQDEFGRTALHIACEAGHEETVEALLEHGSDINVMSKNNGTLLNFAVAGVRSFHNKSDTYFDDDYDDDDRGFCACEIIAEILKSHVVKMKTANLFVSKANLLSINSNYKLSDYQNECEKEIASMKNEKFSNVNVSFYDILTKDICQLAVYAGNESIVQILRSDDYKVKFPIYANMINCNFRKGERRK